MLTLPCVISLVVIASCAPIREFDENQPAPLALESPDGQVQIEFRIGDRGQPSFSMSFHDIPVAEGSLGLEFAGSDPLVEGLRIVGTHRQDHDETYSIPVGKASSARDHHRELIVSLEEEGAAHRKVDLTFRAFNDGIAFRYSIPRQDSLSRFLLNEERTQLKFAGDPRTHALPLKNFTTSYENYYRTLSLSSIGPEQLLGLPILLERAIDDSRRVWIAVTEADLTDYAGMYLSGLDGRPGILTSRLSPLPGRKDQAKVIGQAPFASPWRLLMVADEPGRLLESNLVFHLSAPSAIADPSWIKPGKTTFPWWNGYVVGDVGFDPGVNTATMKHYIEFCAEKGIPYHSLDGLDIAWYGGPIQPDGPTDITQAAPSIDLPEILRFARQKGVRIRLWMHWKALQPQIDEAFKAYEEWGVEGVMVDFMDRDDQEMVRFYHEMAEKAARQHLTVTLHGAYKPTGMERTWPNVLSYEAALNQEYNKWSQPEGLGAPPRHNLDIAFIRMLAGPLDYHQGGMRNVLPEDFKFRDKAPPVQGTRGHQLAMYVVYQNHLPMMADYPAAYRDQPGLDFLTQVPTTWDESKVLEAEFGRCLVIARRSGKDWYLGGMTADQGRVLELPLEFLGDGRFQAEVYLDRPDKGPTSLTTRVQTVGSDEVLRLEIPRDGGFAARLIPKPNEP